MRILDTRHTPRNGLSARSAGLLLLMSIVTLPYVRAQSPKPEKATTAPATVETPVPAPAPATRALELQVVDARSRKPLADVSLRIGLDRKRSDVRTDDEGRYRITDIPAGGATWLTIWAKCEGYSPMTVGWRNEAAQSGLPATFTLAMPRAASYGGVIQDEEGRPIVGATVYVRADSGVGGGTGVPSPTIFEFPARTDAQGRWSCDIIPENADYVATRLVHPDYVSDDHYGDTPQPPIEELRARTAVMVMKRGATLTGVVTDAAGKPVADALVKLGIDRWGSPQPPSTRTDAVGRYRFQVAPGSHALTVIATGFAPELKRLPAVQGTVESSFSLAPARTFRGRVVDPQGRPIAGASVAPDTWRGCRTLEDQRIKTDAEGRFAWTNAPDDEVLFDIVTANHMAIRGRPYRASDAEETITLYPFLRVRGTVTDAASGQPITAFRAVPGVVISEKPFWDYGAAVAARAGKFELRFDDPRTPMVRIEADGYEPAVSRTFRSDEGTQVQDFTLHRVNVDVLSPVVRSPDGTPLAGAEVILATEDSPPTLNNGRYYQRSRAPSTKTNAEGRFSLPVPAGAYSLVILDDRGFAEVSMPRAGAGNDITLAPWGRVEGVLRVGNRPGARLRITADYQDRTRSRFVANYLYSTQADDAGRFVIDRLVPGEYFVAAVLQLPRGIFTASGNGDRVDVRPGETARLTVGGTGRPVVGKFAAPAGIATTIDWSYGHFRISSAGPNRKFFPFNVGPDGSFRVEDVPAGTYVLNVQVYPPPGTVRQPASGPQAWANQQFAVPEMPGGRDDTPLDLGLLELTLSAGAALPPGSHQQPIAAGITGASRADDPRSDLDKIQGEWFRISTDGIKADKTVKLVVKQATNRPEDDAPEGAAAFLFEWKTEGQEGGSRNRVLLNPTGTPRTLDFFPEGEGGPKVCRGIYKLEGDTLTVCFRAVEGERPTGFVAGRRGETLDVYSRAKP